MATHRTKGIVLFAVAWVTLLFASLSLSASPDVVLADGGRDHRDARVTFTKWITTLPSDPSTLAGVLRAGGVLSRTKRGGTLFSELSQDCPVELGIPDY
jgi:hypothetical protein